MNFLIKTTYPFFFLISIFFIRKKNLWVFGCHDGYIDNTKYFFEFASEKNKFTCIWLANNEKDLSLAKNKGYKSILKDSILGYWYSCRAEFTFICTGFSDVNRSLALFSKVISFWHGTPIKKIYLDSTYDLNRFGKNKISVKISTILMKFLTSRITFYYASNQLEQKIVCSSAQIPLTKSMASGAPRHDVMKNQDDFILLNSKKDGRKCYLFAPTWRENGHWDSNFTITENQYQSLNRILKKNNSFLLIKPHPLTSKDEILNWGLRPSPYVIYSDEFGSNDINALYSISDALITDISSSMFDFLIFNRPVILFMPDKATYIEGSRGIYNYFLDSITEYGITSWETLERKLNNPTTEIPLLKNLTINLSKRNSSNEIIYTDIVNRFYRP